MSVPGFTGALSLGKPRGRYRTLPWAQSEPAVGASGIAAQQEVHDIEDEVTGPLAAPPHALDLEEVDGEEAELIAELDDPRTGEHVVEDEDGELETHDTDLVGAPAPAPFDDGYDEEEPSS